MHLAKKFKNAECIYCSKCEGKELDACIQLRNADYINATKFCTSASQRYMAMCRAAVAFAVPPTPFHHSAAKAAHALRISETDNRIYYSRLDVS
jgi:hypothetical protein